MRGLFLFVAGVAVGARMTVELTPLTVEHATAMVSVLSDPSLYEFTGGTPPTLEELTDRYTRQAVGHSPDGTEQWLNWVVLLDSAPVGYVQATVVGDSAEIAWVISPSASSICVGAVGVTSRRSSCGPHPSRSGVRSGR